MAHTNVVVLGLASMFTLIACGGAAAGPEADGNDPAAAPSAPQTPPPDGGGHVDAGADGNVTPPGPAPLAKHCKGTLASPSVCIEAAQGRAGDVVDVEVVLLGSTACTEAGEAAGRIDLDLSRFELTNPVEHVACKTRMVSPSITQGNPDQIVWQAFGNGSLVGCPDMVPLGKADTLKIRIKPGTPPGDYKLTWDGPAFIGIDVACQNVSAGVAGMIRVLP